MLRCSPRAGHHRCQATRNGMVDNLPNRILRDGINSSPRINTLSMGAEILYRRLMSVVDDYGRFHASPITIRGACWPTCPDRVTEAEIEQWLRELSSGERPLIRIYQATVLQRNNPRYLEITDFGQQIRSKSKFPEPAIILLADCNQNDTEKSSDAITTTTAPATTNTTTTTNLTRAREIRAAPPERFVEWLRPWPRVGKPDAACQAWLSVVVTPEDETSAFAARDRYLASDEVARNIIQEPAAWLYDQGRGGFSGRWPGKNGGQGEERRREEFRLTELFIAECRSQRKKLEDLPEGAYEQWKQNRQKKLSPD